MNIDFELSASLQAQDPNDFVTWGAIIDAFNNKISTSRTINGNPLTADITLVLASNDFVNQGTTTTILHGNAAGNPSWGAIVANDITNSAITYNKIQNISASSRLLGRITAGAGILEELTGTQTTSLLDLFSTSTTTKGLVPGSNSVGTSYFLRADGTWAIPPITGVGTDHATLTNLSYAASGHTGFEPTITSTVDTTKYFRGDKTWVVPTHNDTSGLQGGVPGEYYHLTASRASTVTAVTTTSPDAVPTGLSCSSTGISTSNDGTQFAYAVLTWNAIITSTFDHYHLRYKKSSDTYYNYITSNTNSITLNTLIPGVTYNFGIASVNKYGAVSSFSSDINQAMPGDTGVPDNVTGVSAAAGIQYVLLTWTHVSNVDRDSYRIYRNTINDSATSTLIGESSTDYFIDGNRTGGTILYYWVKAVDTSGNLSTAFSSSVNATPRNVQTADVEVIDANKILINGAVYLSNWRHSSDITKIDGGNIFTSSVTATQISVSNLSSLSANLGHVTAGDIIITTGSDKIWLNDADDGSLNIGGSTKASAPFRVTAAGALTATSASITGTITATSGAIGGWSIDSDSIYKGTKVTGNGYAAAAGDLTIRSDGSFHAKSFYIDADGTSSISGIQLSHLIPKTASNNYRHTDSTEEYLYSTAWALMKKFTFTNGMLGSFRTSLDVKKIEHSLPGNAYARIYKNGVAYGTQRTATAGYVTHIEDFTVDLNPGDTIELWGYSDSDIDIYVDEFKIGYDNNFPIAVDVIAS